MIGNSYMIIEKIDDIAGIRYCTLWTSAGANKRTGALLKSAALLLIYDFFYSYQLIDMVQCQY
ncbi:MAG TPA: hypothetical protein DCP68_04480 [Ruminococcus sp.]|nr:hypothetical protein [Ruminococcus sp.]